MIGQGWPQERQYVDLKDRDGTWLVGLVMAKNETLLRVRCEGWPPRYDETFAASQEALHRHAKIQPFRTHTRGYTGQRKNNASRQHWKFTSDDHEAQTKKLEAFIQSVNQKTPLQLWQYLRGEHYFYIDFLMSLTYSSHEDLIKVYNYFNTHNHLCKLYIQKMLASGIKEWLLGEVASDSNQKEDTWFKAYRECYYQIFQALYSIAGLNERLGCFIRGNQKNIKNIVGIFQTHENYVSNELQMQGTFSLIKSVINASHLAVINETTQEKLPFVFAYTILQMFLTIQKTLLLQKDPELGQLMAKTFVVVKKILNEIDAEIMKSINDREIDFILANLRSIFIRNNKKELVCDWIEQFRIKYFSLGIKSNSLQKKLRGIQKIKEYSQGLLYLAPNREPKMSQQKFKHLFTQLKCQEILFEHSQHTEIFKKSIELVCQLYKFGMADISSLSYTWNHCINKEPAVVKHLHHNWNQVALRIPPNDHTQFTQIVSNFYSSGSPLKDTNESVQFIFGFVNCLTKNFNYLHCRKEGGDYLNRIQQNITLLIQELYEILVSNQNRDNQQILIQYYSRIVLWSSSMNHFILQLFSNLTHPQYFRISLSILSIIYQQTEDNCFFVPQNFSSILLNCLKVSSLNLKQTSILMKLLNRILLTSKHFKKSYEMRKEDYKQYWDYFQSGGQDKRAIFYQWVSQSRKAEYEDEHIKTYDLFSNELKDYIVTDIFCEESFADLAQLTKKQLEIILQFFIEKNIRQLKLEEKNYYSDFRIVYRLKNIQLIKENFLWTIFQKCKNSDVIHALNKSLIAFYFHYSPSVSYSLKKGRVDEFLMKIKANLDTGYKDQNNELIKNTLMLLKNVIQLIKEDKKIQSTHSLNISNIKAQIFYEGKTYQLDVKFQDTISNIKSRVANFLSLKPTGFKLLNIKQEQLGFDYKDIPISCFSEKYFKVAEIPQEEETLTKFIHTFLNEQIEQILFKMLEREKTAFEVYQVLDELDFKQEKRYVFKRITNILDNNEHVEAANLISIHCFYLLQIKLINRHLEDRQFLQQCCTYHNFSRFLRMMSKPIKILIHINFLYLITSLLIRMQKKSILSHKKQVAQRCLDVIHEIYQYAETRKVDGHVKQLLTKINSNCIFLIQDIITQSQVLVFLFTIQNIEGMLQLIFFSTYFEEIQQMFIDRLKKYISMYRITNRRNEFAQKRMGDIFINRFYPKLIKFFEERKLRFQSKTFHKLFPIIAKVIQTISVQKNNPSDGNLQKINQLYKNINYFLRKMINCKQLRSLQSSRFIITGHFGLLKILLENHRQLKSNETINFVLVQCLGGSINSNKSPLCRYPQQIQSALDVIRVHLQQQNSTQYLKSLIDWLGPCQRVTFWRYTNRWAISVSPQGKQQYCGLINPGCICYMNSLLQQLFMIEEFRNGIFAIQTQKAEDISEEAKSNMFQRRSFKSYSSIIEALKNLFLSLLFTEENTINPVPFAGTIKNSQNKPMIRLTQQMDIDQFQSILFDKLQKELQNLKSRNLIRQLFGGVYSNQIVSSQCPHKSQRQQSFISINLQVKKNIYQSFKSFVKVDLLDGENKYFCESCNKKVKAEKIQSIKKLPPYLILCLKRFEFNFQIQTKIKINDYCQFYPKLKLKQFSTQQLNRNSSIDQENDTKQAALSDDYYNYKLRGVVVHTGSADSGHYYSFIENKQGKWFEFNDEEVYPFDVKKLPQEAFGSKGLYDDGRIRNAYLLIYQRQTNEHSTEQMLQSKEKNYGIESNKPIVDEIIMKNQEMQKYQLVFSQSYAKLIQLMNQAYHKLDVQESNNISQKWQEFFLSYYFLILIRKENFQFFLQMSEQLQKQIIRNQAMCISYLKLFASCRFLQQFFIYNPVRERCKIISHLFHTALMKFSEHTKEVDFVRNQLVQIVLTAIKVIIMNYGQVYELQLTLRKYLQYLASNNITALHYCIYFYSFQTVFLDQIFNNVIQQSQKEESSKLLIQNKQTIVPHILIPIDFSDKKHNYDEGLEIWRIIYILFKEDIKIIKQSSQVQESIPFIKNFQHLISIISLAPTSKIMSAIYECRQQSGVDYLYSTFKQINLLQKLRQAIEKGLKDYESSKYRSFMLLILAFINDPSTTDEDVDTIVTILQNAYKHNEKYFLEVDLLNQWIMRFTLTNYKFLKRFEERKPFLQNILTWITKTPHPNSEHLKKHKIPNNERLLNRYYGIVVSSDSKDYQLNNKHMKIFYEAVLNSTASSYMSPIIRIEEPYLPNKPIKYFDMVLLKWIDSMVVKNQFGYLTIRVGSKESNNVNLWEDSERIKVCTEDEIQQYINSEESNLSYEESDQSQKN